MKNKKWTFDLDGHTHTLELQHSTSGVKTKVWHNGHLALEHGDMLTITHSADFPIDIDGHVVVIHIRPKTFGSQYHLAIDGIPAPGETAPKTTVAKDKRRMQFTAAMFTAFVGAPLLILVGRDGWQVNGIRADYIGYFSLPFALGALIRRYFTRRSKDTPDEC